MAKSIGYALKERAYIGSASPPDTFEDESRFGNNGVHTDITWVKNPAGLWVRGFNGSSSHVVIPDAPSVRFTDNLTLLIWCYPTVDQHEGILSKYGVDDGWGEYALIHTATTNRARVNLNNNGSDTTFNDLVFSLTRWHHLAVTYSKAAGKIYGYLDGVKSTTEGSYATSITTTTDDLYLGLYYYTLVSGDGRFNGDLAHFGELNYALSAGKIKQMFEAERHLFGI